MKTTSLLEPLEQRIAPAFTGSPLALGGLNGDTGYKIKGDADFDFTGSAVSSAGDINGDGLDDLLVGAPYQNDGITYLGATYVVFGTATPGASSLSVKSLNGTNGFKLIGEEDESFAGGSVSAAGDVNGDGIDDLVIGAPGAGAPPGTADFGAAYVIFGHKTPFAAKLDLTQLDGKNGFGLYGSGQNHLLGASVSAAGDVNHDGFDDVIIGAPGADGDQVGAGAAYVILGKAGNFSASVGVASFPNSLGFKIGGVVAGDGAGSSVGGGGDVNGDGYDDLIIGASGAKSGGTNRGAAYVVFGQASFNGNQSISGLGGSNGFRLDGVADGDRAGGAVAIVGDINADGIDDIGIGAKFADESGTDTGAVYMVFGHTGAHSSSAKLSGNTIDGTHGFKLHGNGNGDYVGGSIHAAGDINGDGRDDLIFGGENAHVGQQKRGAAYVVLGHEGSFTANQDVVFLGGDRGFTLFGSADGDDAGTDVNAAGDVNGDGYGDLIVGASLADEGGDDRGAAYVIYGGPVGTGRSAQASADHKSATFFDTDGDLVTIKVSKGDVNNLDLDLLGTSTATGHLLALHVPASFAGADITISAVPTADGGDGHVNIGFFDATGVDLGKVSIAGNVEHVAAGNAAAPAPALKSFTAQSVGEGALPAHDTFGGDYASEITGKVGSVTIKGDLNQADFLIKGDVSSVTIGGSILGGEKDLEGIFRTTGSQHIGTLKIGHDIKAGSGKNTGAVFAGSIGTATIGGSILGGNGDFYSGEVSASTDIGSITVGHDVRDASIHAGGKLGKATIGGSLIATDDNVISQISAFTIGSLNVKGSITGTSDHLVNIAAGGTLTTAKSQLAIASITVGGSVEHAMATTGRSATNGHTQIGKVNVGGDWVASSIAAGALTSTNNYDLTQFGNSDDTLLAGGPVGVVSRIASIVIKGEVRGTAGGGDHFGFVAQEIGSLKVGALKYALHKGVKEDFALGSTGDFKLHEI